MNRPSREVLGTDSVPPSIGTWVRGLVQKRADDVVLAAALCKPNATGAHELASLEALGQRQLLKARGTYLAETVVLGITPLHVHALGLFLGRWFVRDVACWARAELCATRVAARGVPDDPDWPALLLMSNHRKPFAELQVMQRDDDARKLVALLLRPSCERP